MSRRRREACRPRRGSAGTRARATASPRTRPRGRCASTSPSDLGLAPPRRGPSPPMAARRREPMLSDMTTPGMHKPRNIAARAGRWSARHRTAAIVGWLIFVVLAIGAGAAVGTKTINDDNGPGEAGRADPALNHAFHENSQESVLVQSRHGSSRDAEFAAGVRE